MVRVIVISVAALAEVVISFFLWAFTLHMYASDMVGTEIIRFGILPYLTAIRTPATPWDYEVDGPNLFWTALISLVVWLPGIWFIRHAWRAAWPGRLANFMVGG